MSEMQICKYLWIAFLVLWVIWASRTKAVQRREGISSRLSYTLLTIAAAYMMFADTVPRAWLLLRIVPPDGCNGSGLSLLRRGLPLRCGLAPIWEATGAVPSPSKWGIN